MKIKAANFLFPLLGGEPHDTDGLNTAGRWGVQPWGQTSFSRNRTSSRHASMRTFLAKSVNF